MAVPKAYEEIVDFIAAGTSPQSVIAFRPSEVARQRVWDLVALRLSHCRWVVPKMSRCLF